MKRRTSPARKEIPFIWRFKEETKEECIDLVDTQDLTVQGLAQLHLHTIEDIELYVYIYDQLPGTYF